jgi:hypothetical protein
MIFGLSILLSLPSIAVSKNYEFWPRKPSFSYKLKKWYLKLEPLKNGRFKIKRKYLRSLIVAQSIPEGKEDIALKVLCFWYSNNPPSVSMISCRPMVLR